MMSANSAQARPLQTSSVVPEKIRRVVESKDPLIFTDIYQDETNIAIWQRELSVTLQSAVKDFLALHPTFQMSAVVTPNNVLSSVSKSLGEAQFELSENIAELVDMFCCLFDLNNAGLRLAVLSHAMCPKFHVDKIPCRLVTTYEGTATEWLPHSCVNRTKLGTGSHGLSDSESGLYQNDNDIQKLNAGDVALLKGELWKGNENAGLVHRSPSLAFKQRRLLLTLDFSD